MSFKGTAHSDQELRGRISYADDAYQIARKNGFEGTEKEWLASLKGEPGKDGNTPQKGVDYFDGKNGEDGDSGVYILSEGETLADAPADVNVVIDPNGKETGGSYTLTEADKQEIAGMVEAPPGYTPVKGTDYWTEADKAEMVNEVIAKLPVYNGEVVAE